MKLDPNCVREILLFLETENCVVTTSSGAVELKPSFFDFICEHISRFTPAEIYYTLSRLDEGGYISLSEQWASDQLYECCVNYITFAGHEFLEKIRPETAWEKTSNIAAKFGTASLQMLEKIAEGVATAYFKTSILGN